MVSLRTLWLRIGGAFLLAFSGAGVIGVNVFYVVFSWWTIQLSFWLLRFFYEDALLFGNVIVVGKRVIELIPACIAAGAYLLLALLILFTKGISLRKGIVLFFVGSVLILLANVIRIDILIALLLNDGVNYFEKLHLLFWKVLSSIYVAGVWIFLSWWFKIKGIPVYSDVRSLLKQYKLLQSFIKDGTDIDPSQGFNEKQLRKLAKKFGKGKLRI